MPIELEEWLLISVPDPPDPHVFGPPGSGSTSQRYGSGSGSFYHQCCGPGSGIRDPGLGPFWPLDPGSGIGLFRIPDLGSRISGPGSQTRIFESLVTTFWVKSSIILWNLAQIFFLSSSKIRKNSYFWELSGNFLGKKFHNSLKFGPNFFLSSSKIK
jgi:hypothetical protein